MREEMIFTQEELKRIRKSRSNTIYADIHGMNCKQARRFLRNLIAVHREAFTLTVIHGYHHGTSLRDMIAAETLSQREQSKRIKKGNPGQTEVVIA